MNNRLNSNNHHRSTWRNGSPPLAFAGFMLVALSLIACELPVILAVGGLSTAMAFKSHPLVELAGIIAAVIGVVLLFAFAILRRRSRMQCL